MEPTAADKAAEPEPFYPVPLVRGRFGDEELAPELAGITGWLNSEPFTLMDRKEMGKVVLVDFWTYTCINCIRTLPYLRSWYDKYADAGLVVLGVHTPEFAFEHLRENVVKAMAELGVEYPVAQDNDYATWNAFSNRFWPAKYLIDSDGYVRYTHFGEGAYDETERRIRELLTEAGADVTRISDETRPAPELEAGARTSDPSEGMTRELYAGYSRNYSAFLSGASPYVLHEEFYRNKDADILYQDPGSHKNQFIYLRGLWRNTEESLVHARDTQEYEDYIAIKFNATSVNAVMAPGGTEELTVRVRLNDEPLPRDISGSDVMFDGDGESYVVVDAARLYRIVDIPEFAGHELTLSSNSAGFSFFAFTFGAYEGGEPVS